MMKNSMSMSVAKFTLIGSLVVKATIVVSLNVSVSVAP